MLKIFGRSMKKRIIKYVALSISSLVLLFVGWQALLIANVYMAKKTARMMIGRDYYMHDYYYADISNITYTGHNFLLYVQKPFLFSPDHFYLYSSTDGITWTEVFSSWFGGLGGSVTSKRFNRQQVFDESGELFTYIPRELGKPNAYGQYWFNFPAYNSSGVCSIKYSRFSAYNYIVSSSNCETEWHINKYKAPFLAEIEQKQYPKINLHSFDILNKLVRDNNLNINLGIAHTTYGNGKYIGVFSKINKYYLIISSDGAHYEIEELPSNVISSLAI